MDSQFTIEFGVVESRATTDMPSRHGWGLRIYRLEMFPVIVKVCRKKGDKNLYVEVLDSRPLYVEVSRPLYVEVLDSREKSTCSGEEVKSGARSRRVRGKVGR